MLTRREYSPAVRSGFDALIDGMFSGSWPREAEQAFPPMDVYPEGGGCVIEFALPGYRKEDLDITLENGVLTVRGQSRQDEQRKDNEYLVKEMRQRAFHRSVRLPFEPDPSKTRADLENGILKLSVLPTESARGRQINIDVK